MTDREFDSYLRLYEVVVSSLPKPDLLIYLKAPVPVLLQRIQIRGRAIEAGIDAAYLSLLDRLYEEWTSSFDLCPILTIQSDAVDFVNREEQLDLVAAHVLDRLAGSEKIVLD